MTSFSTHTVGGAKLGRLLNRAGRERSLHTCADTRVSVRDGGTVSLYLKLSHQDLHLRRACVFSRQVILLDVGIFHVTVIRVNLSVCLVSCGQELSISLLVQGGKNNQQQLLLFYELEKDPV